MIIQKRGRAAVQTEALAQLLERYLSCHPELTTVDIASNAGVGDRLLRKVLARQYETTNLFLADRVCTALGSHIELLQARAVA